LCAYSEGLHVLDDDPADLVCDVLEAVDYLLEVVIDLGTDHEGDRILLGEIQLPSTFLVQLVGLTFDPNDLLGEHVQAPCLLTDRAQQRNGLEAHL
jgi:hypothetical protein